jgi:hypothetical protein
MTKSRRMRDAGNVARRCEKGACTYDIGEKPRRKATNRKTKTSGRWIILKRILEVYDGLV